MSLIKTPTISQRTNYADINQFIDNTENYLTELATDLNTAFAELPQYSTEPQQIATWIDGSPIYRKAFDVLLKDMSEVDYADVLNNSTFMIGMISSSGAAYPISAFCVYEDANNRLYHCGIDLLTDTTVDFAIPGNVAIPENQSDCTTERHYGYINFIKTGDDA